MLYENIPDALARLPNWVCYNGSKVPFQGDIMLPASISNAKTWCDFQTALSHIGTWYSHIGLALQVPIVCIDLDHCIDETGQLSPLAMDILSHCEDAYIETSMSGSGLHIFTKGKLPISGLNTGEGLEIYQSRRFIVMTGNVYKDHYSDLSTIQQGFVDYVWKKATEMTKACSGRKTIYHARYSLKGTGGKVRLKPKFRLLPEGARHIGLVSAAGTIQCFGISLEYLHQINKECCSPPLTTQEVDKIVKGMKRRSEQQRISVIQE